MKRLTNAQLLAELEALRVDRAQRETQIADLQAQVEARDARLAKAVEVFKVQRAALERAQKAAHEWELSAKQARRDILRLKAAALEAA